MNEELDYAEMLEIPVETITVRKKEKKKWGREPDLQEQLVEQINDRMEEADDPAYAESKPIARNEQPKKERNWQRILLVGEFVAICFLCATIFFTNLFLTDSAINTFVRGLVQGSVSTADGRTYQDFTLSSVVNDYSEAEIAVSETGVLSFREKGSVYSPCEGTVSTLNGSKEEGYTVEIKHSDSFSTIISGLNVVYAAAGDQVRSNLPLGFSNGEGDVRVMFYSDGALLNCYTLNGENDLVWS